MISSAELAIPHIRARLAAFQPRTLTPGNRSHAAVAMLLRAGQSVTEVLFIIRAPHEQDPWSGNIGFPGGRLQPGNESPREAAERETWEELGIDLGDKEQLGRLDDLYGATLPVLVSCFVYHLRQETPLQPNHEVAKAFWYPLPQLLRSEHHQKRTFNFRGEEGLHPVVVLSEPQAPLLWGITYRLFANFFSLYGQPFPVMEPGPITTRGPACPDDKLR